MCMPNRNTTTIQNLVNKGTSQYVACLLKVVESVRYCRYCVVLAHYDFNFSGAWPTRLQRTELVGFGYVILS